MGYRQVSDTRTISAPASDIFDLLADPDKHPLIDGSGTVKASRAKGPRRLKLGDKFGMDMHLGLPYKVLNTVVEFEEDRLIAWRHFYGHRWRWQLTDLGDGRTEVTETFDWSTARIGFLLELVKFPGKNLKSIRATLDRLEQRYA
ncbi:SRPBCC family protein [Actinokineospora sp. HUAS TT18]|uniref:SRPBCC family protein n=1 Tax=Actinokineospora sp. HUAS TT18 TaxID=3447451 RepID=UPI003F51CFDA